MDKRVFFEKVTLMRETQKEYFRTRSHDALRKSKALEADIDREIERVRALGYSAPAHHQQPTIFCTGSHEQLQCTMCKLWRPYDLGTLQLGQKLPELDTSFKCEYFVPRNS